MNAFVINLDSRPDRMTLFEENNFPFKVTRFPAVHTDNGSDGCTLSHLSIISQQTQFPFIVFEDDCMMIQSWVVVETAMKQLPRGWDALWLGATIRQPLKRQSTNLYRLKNAFCLHAVIYNSKAMIDYIIHNHNTPSGKNLDIFYHKKVLDRFNCYITYPICATQRFDYSDICKSKVDYHKEILNSYYKWIP